MFKLSANQKRKTPTKKRDVYDEASKFIYLHLRNKTENAKETASLDGDAQAHGLIDLVRTPNMRSKSLKLFYCW